MDEATERKLLGLLGLGVRGRLAKVGVDQVREAVKRGQVRVAVVATDASHNSRDKVEPLLKAKGVPVVHIASAEVLGGAAGRQATAVIGIVDAQLAKGIHALLDAGTR